MKYLLNTIFTFYLMISCTHQKIDKGKLFLLKKDVLKGDIYSYEKLSLYYFDNNLDSLLPYSKIMADTFEYPRAYYDVFEIMYTSNSIECHDYNLSCLDSGTRKTALYYFIKAIEKGDKTSSNIFLNYYDKERDYPIKELYENLELVRIAKLNLTL